ncbi:MAG TPA: hypothetical protein PKJ23_08120, partial [bacterium]|nr:hypothetical protein [bacterium]
LMIDCLNHDLLDFGMTLMKKIMIIRESGKSWFRRSGSLKDGKILTIVEISVFTGITGEEWRLRVNTGATHPNCPR